MAEKRLIDYNEAKRRIIAFATGIHSEVLSVDTIIMILTQCISVDAVEVVRCCKCKHRDPEDKKCDCGCWHMPFVTKDDDFCPYRKRKNGDGNG